MFVKTPKETPLTVPKPLGKSLKKVQFLATLPKVNSNNLNKYASLYLFIFIFFKFRNSLFQERSFIGYFGNQYYHSRRLPAL